MYLWEQMTYLYGHKFTSTNGESAVVDGVLTDVAKTWSIALTGITGDQIATGLQACVNSGNEWPPSVPGFVAMCKSSNTNEHGMNYTPEMYHKKNRPIRDRSRILSSDDREKARLTTKNKIHELANNLRSQQGKVNTVKNNHKPNSDALDYFFMLSLCEFKNDVPNIVERINTFKPGSLNYE